MRILFLLQALFLAARAGGSDPACAEAEHFKNERWSLFFACQFLHVVQTFERALALVPANAKLSFWLGKSYARLAEPSCPLSAQWNARTALRHLQQAVGSDPQNGEYPAELFLFPVTSPVWSRGGIERGEVIAATRHPIGLGRSRGCCATPVTRRLRPLPSGICRVRPWLLV